MKNLISWLVCGVLGQGLLGGPASAQPVLIANSDVTVGPLDTQIVDQQTNTPVNLETARITVRGRTLTVNGRHRIASLTVDSAGNIAGRITHSPGFWYDYDPGEGVDLVRGMHLIVTNAVTVSGPGGTIAGGFITANSCGYAAGTGPGTPIGCVEAGGAGHGGRGGNGSTCVGGVSYGSIPSPSDFGSGSSATSCGAAGGGMIRLEAGGTLTVNGSITAHGGNGTCANGGSGGAGGSIWVTCGQLSGSGTIASHGGYSPDAYRGGGGAGGRIAVYCGSNAFSGSMSAYGGNGYGSGGAGTIWTRVGGAGAGSLSVVNSVAGPPTPLPEEIVEIDVLTVARNALCVERPLVVNMATIGGGGRIVTELGSGIELDVLGDLTIDTNGVIDVDGRGYAPGAGPGASAVCRWPGGAGHGGVGAMGLEGCAGGAAYGSVTEPSSPGSGGARSTANSDPSCGGRGGGVVRLNVAGTFTLNGTIRASGLAGHCQGGGGAGGSTWITCGTIAGSGSVSVNGGAGWSEEQGGGAGGRIALYYTNSTFTGGLAATGETGYQPGGSGTVWTKAASAPVGSLRVAGRGGSSGATPVPPEIEEIDVLTVTSAVLRVDHPLVVRSASLAGTSKITHTAGNPEGLRLSVVEDLVVGVNASINGSSCGYEGGAGPGASAACVETGGAGHGGRGGDGRQCAGGATYGSLAAPATLGSGGYSASCGGRGGGLVRLGVGGILTLNGSIAANGGNGSCSTLGGGGGAGGSVWVTCYRIVGDGLITAIGGNSSNSNRGGGGGGRVAIYSCNLPLPMANIRVTPGIGYMHPTDPSLRAQAGTVFIGSASGRVVEHPGDQHATVGHEVRLEVVAETTPPNSTLVYQWRRRTPEGGFVPLVEGPRFTGVTTAALSISNAVCADSGSYNCQIRDDCGVFLSDEAELTVTSPADFNGDGTLDFFDYLDFVAALDAEDPAADFNADGQVDFFDYLDFAVAFDFGCG